MKPHLKTVGVIVGGTALSMAMTWGLRAASGRPYEFPDGWFVGAFVSIGLILIDRSRKKAFTCGDKQK